MTSYKNKLKAALPLFLLTLATMCFTSVAQTDSTEAVYTQPSTRDFKREGQMPMATNQYSTTHSSAPQQHPPSNVYYGEPILNQAMQATPYNSIGYSLVLVLLIVVAYVLYKDKSRLEADYRNAIAAKETEQKQELIKTRDTLAQTLKEVIAVVSNMDKILEGLTVRIEHAATASKDTLVEIKGLIAETRTEIKALVMHISDKLK